MTALDTRPHPYSHTRQALLLVQSNPKNYAHMFNSIPAQKNFDMTNLDTPFFWLLCFQVLLILDRDVLMAADPKITKSASYIIKENSCSNLQVAKSEQVGNEQQPCVVEGKRNL